MSQRPKVALGMSGGVDSSLSAHLLVEQGYDVTGVYLECWRAPGCRTEEDRKDALAVALQLNIPFQVLDFKEAYRQKVVEYFFAEYATGRTPNPDVMCNKEIKFGLFYDWAIAQGFEFVATGHYAQVLPHAQTHEPALVTSTDTHKDQTYFLYRLHKAQLAHILFPIGHLTKPQVRTEAKKRQIPVADKKDSVGICFIGDINVHHFLEERLGKKPGDVVDMHSNVIGTHEGLWFYTIGQRHGFTIFPKVKVINAAGESVDKHNIPPFYVVQKKPAENQLVVGFGAETAKQEFDITDVNWLVEEPLQKSAAAPQHMFVRIRHTGELYPCTVKPNCMDCGSGSAMTLHAVLDAPAQGIAQGQSAVLYQKRNDELFTCLGGGVLV